MYTAFPALWDHGELSTTTALETIRFCKLYRRKLLLNKKHIAPRPVPFPGQTWVFDRGSLYLTESQNPYFIESKMYFFLFDILEIEMCLRVTVAWWQFCCGCHYLCAHQFTQLKPEIWEKSQEHSCKKCGLTRAPGTKTCTSGKQDIGNSKSKVLWLQVKGAWLQVKGRILSVKKF